MKFICSSKHPFISSYRKLVLNIGGREVGYTTGDYALFTGERTDTVMFEIVKK